MAQAAKGSDLNPDFSFEFASGYAPAQAPWEMSGTRRNSMQKVRVCILAPAWSLFLINLCLAGAAGQTLPAVGVDLDDKIKQRLLARKQRGNSGYTPEV